MQKWHGEEGRSYIVNEGFPTRMPRYWKEKLFTEEQREKMREEAIPEAEKAYWKQFNKLKRKGYEDPDAEMERRAIAAALKVDEKISKNDSL